MDPTLVALSQCSLRRSIEWRFSACESGARLRWILLLRPERTRPASLGSRLCVCRADLRKAGRFTGERVVLCVQGKERRLCGTQ